MLAHKENPQRTLFPRDNKAMAMKVGICFGVCNNPPSDLLHCECSDVRWFPINKERAAEPGENGLKWLKMGENGWQFKCATSSMHKQRKETCYGTTNL